MLTPIKNEGIWNNNEADKDIVKSGELKGDKLPSEEI